MAADSGVKVATPHLLANGAAAVFSLEVDDDGTVAIVEQGSVTLSTPDGGYRSQLAAGAAARIGRQDAGALMIQNAPGQPFTPASTLEAVLPEPKASTYHDNTEPTSDLTPVSHLAITETLPDPIDDAASVDTVVDDTALDAQDSEASLDVQLENRSETFSSVVILPASRKRPSNALEARASLNEKERVDGNPSTVPAATPVTTGQATDTLQHQFNQLTEGLISGLPEATKPIRRNHK